MIGPTTFRAQDVVCVTSEDDAFDDLSIRMEHARRLRERLEGIDPNSLVVHHCDGLVTLMVRGPDGMRLFTIGTTLARRFGTDAVDATARTAMLDTAIVALDRYGTIDPRQAEMTRRARAVLACVVSEQTTLMPGLAIEQARIASACPWSPMEANLGGWEDDEWREPFVDLPEGSDVHLPPAVDLSIAVDGRATIRSHTSEWPNSTAERDFPTLDAMTRLRLRSDVLRSERFPHHPRPGRG